MQHCKSRKFYSMVFLALITGILLTLFSTISVYAAIYTPVEGVTVNVSGATDNSMSNGAVTVTAKGSGGIFGIGAYAKTATITITNNSGSNATVSFNWTATSVNELKIDGIKYTNASGSFSKQLDADAKITITITTAKNGTTNKLVLNNFKVVKAGQTYTGTFNFDSSLGSVTVDSNAISNGGTASIKTEGTPIIANPKSGVTFLAWIDANTHERISMKASDTLVIDSDRMIRAVFVNSSSNAWFIVGGSYYYDNLNDALAQVGKVGTVSDKTIVVASNGTLPTGNYTIPSGVTLLIPFNDANTLYTNRPETVEIPSGEKLVNTTPYRTLTIADGANITVNGAISVSGKVCSSQPYNGVTSGPAGFINMNKGSSVTVNTNGKLYAWGYIQGDGTVTIKSNGVVYECFQVRDFRGGTATSGMIGNDQEVFPMSQYYIQNIQVPMTIEAGAKEYAYFAATLSLVGTQPAEIPFIGENAMFNITSGYLVKDYDEQSDRLIVNVFGNVTVRSFEFSIKLGLIGSATIKSEEYKLPLTSHMTVNVNSGKLSISQDIAMLPESVLYIAEGAQCVLTDKSELIVYDFDNWGNYCYPSATMCAWPYASVSRTIAKDATVKVDGTLDATNGYLYTTAGGANIYSKGSGKIIIGTSGTDTKTYQATQGGSDGKTITYNEIPITSAKLKNADATYAQTANCKTASASKPLVMTYTHGKWVCDSDGHTYNVVASTVIQPSCTSEGSATYKCAVCGDEKIEITPAVPHEFAGFNWDDTDHWNDCNGCGEINRAAHYDSDDEDRKCDTCGYSMACEEHVTDTREVNIRQAGCVAHGYYDEETYCTVCNEVIHTEKNKIISARGYHNPGAEWQHNGTNHWKICVDCGNQCENTTHTGGTATCKEQAKCTNCGEAYGKLAAHTYDCKVITDAYKASNATCIAKATYYYSCVCGAKGTETFEDGNVNSNSHVGDTEDIARVEATCTTPGITAGVMCLSCEKAISGCEVIDINPDAHDMQETETAVAPDCDDAGKTAVYTCANGCGQTEGGEEVAALGHDWADATCTTAKTCGTCGETEGEALGHSWDNDCDTTCNSDCGYTRQTSHDEATKEEDRVEATCGADGSYTLVTYCSVCNTEIRTESKTIEATGEHVYATETKRVNATCTEDGYVIKACGCGATEETTLTQTGHSFTTKPSESEKTAATCKDVAVYWAKCDNCDEVSDTVTVNGTAKDPDNHVGETEDIDEVPATCLGSGVAAGKKCLDCNKVIEGCEKTTKLDCADTDNDHFCDKGCGQELTTCEDGDKDHKCDFTGCQAELSQCVDDNHDHNCDYEGCSKTLGVHEDLNPKNHKCDYGCATEDFGACVDTNGDGKHYCEYCGKTEFACADGNDDYLCDECGENMCEHSMTFVEAVNPDCENNGTKEHYKCQTCERLYQNEDGTILVTLKDLNDPMLGHKDEAPTKDHICDRGCGKTDLGEHEDSATDKDHVCDYCGQAVENGEPCSDASDDGDHNCDICGNENVTDHDWADADCDTPKTCSECGDTEGSALGHTYDNNSDENCNVCGYERDLTCEHVYDATGYNEMYRWNQCSKCQAIDEASKTGRKYTIIFKGIEGGQDITLQGEYGFNDTITVPMIKSRYFEFTGDWTVDGQELTPQSQVKLSSLKSLIGADDSIMIEGSHKIIGLKSDAVMMSVQYGDTAGAGNEDIFMTVSLFVNVDAGMSPIVTIGDQRVNGEQFGTLDAYYYRIPLTYEDLLDDNLAVVVAYEGANYSEALKISISEYFKALTAMFGDENVAGTKELIAATTEYVKAAQAYFNRDYSKLSNDPPTFAYDGKLLTNEYFGEATKNSKGVDIAKFEVATVNMGKTYELVYRFTENLPEKAKLLSAQIILTNEADALTDRTQRWDEITGTAYEAKPIENDGVVECYQVTIKNVPASEMAIKYVTIYLVYEDETGEVCVAYSQTLKYGVTTYLHRQLYEFQDGKFKNDYANNKDMWLVATMFDKLRTLAGMAGSTVSDTPSDVPSVEESTPNDSTN